MNVTPLRLPKTDSGLILRGGDHFGNRGAKDGMTQPRGKLGQRHQNEAALGHARMRDFHFFRVDYARAIK